MLPVSKIAEHYGDGDLKGRLRAALAAAGLGTGPLSIADRPGLYREIHRVLRRGGRLAIYDVVEGNGAPLHFPVPWAREPVASFLVTSTAMRGLLDDAGFRVVDWADRTEAANVWFAQINAAAQAPATPPPLGLHVAMGPNFRTMGANLARNLREGRSAIVQAVLERV